MELELKENEAKQERRIGEAVFYGELIQLQHTLTKKYVAVSYSDTSLTEDTKLRVRCAMYRFCHAWQIKITFVLAWKVRRSMSHLFYYDV